MPRTEPLPTTTRPANDGRNPCSALARGTWLRPVARPASHRIPPAVLTRSWIRRRRPLSTSSAPRASPTPAGGLLPPAARHAAHRAPAYYNPTRRPWIRRLRSPLAFLVLRYPIRLCDALRTPHLRDALPPPAALGTSRKPPSSPASRHTPLAAGGGATSLLFAHSPVRRPRCSDAAPVVWRAPLVR
jgi:hypothetical protein